MPLTLKMLSSIRYFFLKKLKLHVKVCLLYIIWATKISIFLKSTTFFCFDFLFFKIWLDGVPPKRNVVIDDWWQNVVSFLIYICVLNSWSCGFIYFSYSYITWFTTSYKYASKVSMWYNTDVSGNADCYIKQFY